MTIRRILDALDKEIQMHQASIRRLTRRRQELIDAAMKTQKKEKARGRK